MIYVRVTGGIGNQLFQLAAGKELSIRTGMPISIFTGHLGNYERPYPYQLKKLITAELNVKSPNSLIKFFVKKRINKLVPFLFPWYVNNKNLNKVKKSGDYLLDDYFQVTRLIENGLDWIISEIRKTAIENKRVQDVYNMIIAKHTMRELAAVHIRRADYLSPKNSKVFYYLDDAYYNEAIKHLPCSVSTLVVFSEEETKHMAIMKQKTTIVIKEYQLSDVEEFLLMSLFANRILANSTFSFLSAMASPEKDVCRIAPAKWTFLKQDSLNWRGNLEQNNFIII